MSGLFYKRPNYIFKEKGPLNESSCQKYAERAACSRAQIPDELSFDNVLQGKTLPPCSLDDFLDYLIYVAHDAENLQFYLWLQDYTKRFAALSPAEQALSPEWKPDQTLAMFSKGTSHPQTQRSLHTLGVDTHKYFNQDSDSSADATPPTPFSPDMREQFVDDANTQAGLKWKSFSIQPFRQEINLVVSHYVASSSPRELNLSHKDRSAILHAIQHTTHPSAFAPLLDLVSDMLRHQSHPNFIRWSICNGNRPRVIFLRSFAVFWLTAGTILALLLILSSQSRWWRLFVAPIWWFGTCNLVAAYKGLCVLLFRRRTREIHPWEISDTAPLPTCPDSFSTAATVRSNSTSTAATKSSPILASILETKALPPTPDQELEMAEVRAGSVCTAKLLPLGGSNDFSHESWTRRWRHTSVLRKLVLRTVRVQEEGIRLIQNRIVRQAHMWAVLITVPAVAGVVAAPRVGLLR